MVLSYSTASEGNITMNVQCIIIHNSIISNSHFFFIIMTNCHIKTWNSSFHRKTMQILTANRLHRKSVTIPIPTGIPTA